MLAAKEAAKAEYEKSDEALNKLIEKVPVGEVVEVDGFRYTIEDNFAGKNTGWGHGSVRRYDLVKVKEPKVEKTAAKKAAPKRS
jgi:hypothetical protein